MNGEPLIKFHKVKVSLGKKRDFVLKNISLVIREGESQIIFGPNGSGKSTLLKLMAGLKKSDVGKIERFCERHEIGYIPQHMGLLPMLSVRKNVLLGALSRVSVWGAICGFSTDERNFADDLLKKIGLAKKASNKVSSLSGGERRRVAIARALMQRPKLLLADEILSNLDFLSARKITELLKDMKTNFGLTIVMVEHDLCTANEFGERMILLKNGEMISKNL